MYHEHNCILNTSHRVPPPLSMKHESSPLATPAPAGWLQQFVLFFGVGAVATACHYLCMIALADGLGIAAVPAAVCGYLAGAVTSYWLNYRYTFTSTRAHRSTATRFAMVALGGLALNTLLMAVLTAQLGMHYLLAQVLATGLILCWNFALNKIWTFRA